MTPSVRLPSPHRRWTRRAGQAAGLAAAFAVVLVALGPERGAGAAQDAPAPRLPLSDELRDVVRAEMLQIEGGMARLLGLLVRGEAAAAAAEARQIEASFVLRRALSAEQLEELHHALPTDFAARDHAFHAKAGELAERAGAGDFGRAGELYGELARACVDCHAAYATHRFPALAGAAGAAAPAHGHEPHEH